MLYNMYTDVILNSQSMFSAPEESIMYNNSNVAIRDERYKLMHHYTGNSLDSYDSVDDTTSDYVIGYNYGNYQKCICANSMYGNFTHMLFDLQEDPFEMKNLYNQTEYVDIQV